MYFLKTRNQTRNAITANDKTTRSDASAVIETVQAEHSRDEEKMLFKKFGEEKKNLQKKKFKCLRFYLVHKESRASL